MAFGEHQILVRFVLIPCWDTGHTQGRKGVSLTEEEFSKELSPDWRRPLVIYAVYRNFYKMMLFHWLW